MSYFTEYQLGEIGFKKIGKDVRVSDRASFYGVSRISIGDYTRIDDFCVLSSGEDGIEIGRNVHLSVGVSMVGRGKICIGDFSALSVRVSLFSSNDDYSGKHMVNPTVDEKYTGVTHGDIIVGRHVIIGAGSVVLPNVNIGDGVAIGCLSLAKTDCEDFWIYAGVPVKKISKRSRDLLILEKEYTNERS